MTEEKPSATWSLLLVVITTSLGAWFPIGYSLSQINAPQTVIVIWIRSVQCHRLNSTVFSQDAWTRLWCHEVARNESVSILRDNPTLNSLWSFVGAAMSLGACVAIWSTNYLVRTFGFKMALHIINFPGILGTFLCAFCVEGSSYELFIIGRFILGINMGLASSVLPLYVAELSPPHLRGAMGTIPTILYVIGMLVAVVIGLPEFLGAPKLWYIMSWLRLIPAAILAAVLPFCPESPRYLLLTKNNKQAAGSALKWLRRTNNVNEELDMIESERNVIEGEPTVSVIQLFKTGFLRQNIFICAFAMIDQRFSGYAAVYPYSTAIFSSVGLLPSEALYGTAGVMALQICTTCAGMFLMDRAGRKFLLILGNIGCIVTCVVMVVFSSEVRQGCHWCKYGGLACILVFIISYNIGPGIVPWVLPSEMFSKASRSSAVTVVSFCCHASTMLVTALYPLMQAGMDEWTFMPYAVALVIFTVYFWFGVIETKGKTFNEIQKDLWQKYSQKRLSVTSLELAKMKNLKV